MLPTHELPSKGDAAQEALKQALKIRTLLQSHKIPRGPSIQRTPTLGPKVPTLGCLDPRELVGPYCCRGGP